MNTRKAPRPTEAELRILNVLWQKGPSSVRVVLNALNGDGKAQVGYTTALKMLQIMTDKGLVERDETHRPQIYRAKLAKERTQRQLLDDLVVRVFGGSTKQLVMRALAAKETPEAELEQIERLLDKIEADRNERF